MLSLRSKSAIGGKPNMAGLKTVNIDSDLFERIIHDVTRLTGYKPQIKDFVEKAVLNELSKIEQTAGEKKKASK